MSRRPRDAPSSNQSSSDHPSGPEVFSPRRQSSSSSSPPTSSSFGFNFPSTFQNMAQSFTNTFNPSNFQNPFGSTYSRQNQPSSRRQSASSSMRSQQPQHSPSASCSSSGNHQEKDDECFSCNVKFGFMKKKKKCENCRLDYCVACFTCDDHLSGHQPTFDRLTSASSMHRYLCQKCRIFNHRPLDRKMLMMLKVRDLRWFLEKKHHVVTSGCKEKTELVDLVLHTLGYRQYPDENRPFPTHPMSYRDSSRPDPSVDDNGTSAPHAGPDTHAGAGERETQTPTSSSSSTSSGDNHPGASQPSSDSSSFVMINDDGEEVEERRGAAGGSSSSTPCVTVNPNRQAPSGPQNVLNTNYRMLNTPSGNLRNEDGSSRGSSPSPKGSPARDGFCTHPDVVFSIDDIQSEEQIQSLSIRQLKLILTRNFVDYKGCVEREELVARVTRLWREKKEFKDQNPDDIPDENCCKICMENAIDCVLLECGHMISCVNCGKRLNECPICRQYVVRAVRIFKS